MFKLPEIPKFLKNFYIALSLVFLVWMLFFDGNDLLTQFRNYRKLKQAETERDFYAKKTEDVYKKKAEILGSPKMTEKYARERYLMKKPNEDLYIIKKD